MHIVHMWHIYAHTSSYMHIIYIVYMQNVVGIFVFGTYLEITCEIEVAVPCVLTHICKNVHANVAYM